MATVENCSLADRMDRVYEKVNKLRSPDDTEQDRNDSQYDQYMYQSPRIPRKHSQQPTDYEYDSDYIKYATHTE